MNRVTLPETRTALFVLSAVAISLGFGIVLGSSHFSNIEVLITIVGLLWIFPIVSRVLNGTFDVLEPISITSFLMLVMFFLRPITMLANDAFIHRGYNIRPWSEEAELVVVIGSIAFILGYGFNWIPVRLKPKLYSGELEWYRGTVLLGAITLASMGMFLYAIFIFQSGGLGALLWLAGGKESGQGDLFTSSSGYFYQGQLLLIPASLLFFATGLVEGKRLPVLLSFLLLTPLVALNFGSGGRLALLVAFAPLLLFWMLYRMKRPSFIGLVIAAYSGLVIIRFLGDSRTNEARESSRWRIFWESLTHPANAIEGITQGGDGDMFDTLANLISVVPSELSYQQGSVFVDPLVRMIPRQWWPSGKPMEANDMFVQHQWPAAFEVTRAGPASSFIGQLYQDSGIWTVMLGMFTLGLLLKYFWIWRKSGRLSPTVQLTYAAVIPQLVVLLRGNLTHVLSTAAFTVLPLLIVLWIGHRRERVPVDWQSTAKLKPQLNAIARASSCNPR